MTYQDTFKRYELKYLITKDQKEGLLQAMDGRMALDAYGRTTIMNIYYDTPDSLLIRRSLEKPAYKEKLRLRSYGVASSDTKVFVELKKKYEGIVYKRRTSVTEKEAVEYLNHDRPFAQTDQITEEIDYFKAFYQNLIPAMVISYEREAYFDIEGSDLRITLDENILWREEDLTLRSKAYGTPILRDNQTLVEIKVGGAMPIWLAHDLSELGIFQTSFSKYGNAYLQKELQLRRGKIA
ncbi:MAG: polyphosphate polymerase domain-containing protein [Lachnospiraceae bacterium]|nr:polyphosphate polymerase domain-containing protein [Lachnospiraceae bacterium]MBQ3905968.1 polyphosphate polymerase domain-containing protein [Lachnospiraceae bacterium]